MFCEERLRTLGWRRLERQPHSSTQLSERWEQWEVARSAPDTPWKDGNSTKLSGQGLTGC